MLHYKKLYCRGKVNENLRAEVLEAYVQKGYSIEVLRKNDVGRAAIQENLLNQFLYENKKEKLGYPVLNGKMIEPFAKLRYEKVQYIRVLHFFVPIFSFLSFCC